MANRLFTIQQAARLSGLPQWFLRRAVQEGALRLTPIRKQVIRERDLWLFIADELDPAFFDIDDAEALYALKERANAALAEIRDAQ
jgi:hypothetical protein